MTSPTESDLLPLARDHLIPYTIAFRPDYKPADLHYRIASILEQVEAGELRRVMIWVPPRHGKSMLTSEMFPPWYLGRHPERSVICASYGQDLADDFGRRVRNQMVDPFYQEIFPECVVAHDSASVSRISTQRFGNYYAVGIGSAVVGRGANVLIIDDPVKDRADADSTIMRSRTKEWYRGAAYLRLMPGGAIVIMQTRWHEDDLSGWLLREHEDEGWTVFKWPAEPVPPWPEAFSAERLRVIKGVSGAREWSAQYMQSPTLEGGGVFSRNWVRYYETTPVGASRDTNRYVLVDPAGEKRPDNDYTSMWVVGLGKDGNYRVLDLVRDKMNVTERGRMVLTLHRRWKPRQVRYERYGMMADVQYIRELQSRENYFFELVEVAGKLNKIDRIKRLIPLFETGRMYFPQTFHYTSSDGRVNDLVRVFLDEEMAAFPAGLHDDMLDALARIEEPDLPLVWPKPVESKDEEEEREYGYTSVGEGSWMA